LMAFDEYREVVPAAREGSLNQLEIAQSVV
jgi:hypothetical protein